MTRFFLTVTIGAAATAILEYALGIPALKNWQSVVSQIADILYGALIYDAVRRWRPRPTPGRGRIVWTEHR